MWLNVDTRGPPLNSEQIFTSHASDQADSRVIATGLSQIRVSNAYKYFEWMGKCLCMK